MRLMESVRIQLNKLFKSPLFVKFLVGNTSGNSDYSKAKCPVSGSPTLEFTERNIRAIEEHLKKGGWLGLLIPEGYILIDVDDTTVGEYLYRAVKSLGLKTQVIKTPNGWQFFFRDSGKVWKQHIKATTKSGIIVDYKLSGKGYIVLPTPGLEGREWKDIVELDRQEDLDLLPIFLEPFRCKAFSIPIKEGERNDTLFRHISGLRNLVKNEDEIREIASFINDYLTEKPLGKEELEKTIAEREGYEYSISKALDFSTVKKLTAKDILEMEFPETKWLVEDILPKGLTILTGKPKTGKSWTALNVAIAVATGGKALGQFEAEGGRVCYLALEDTEESLNERLKKVLKGENRDIGIEFTFYRYFVELASKLGISLSSTEKFQDAISSIILSWLKEQEGYSLIIIDTYYLIRPSSNSKKQSGEIDYTTLRLLKEIADSKDMGILILHHSKKVEEEDPLNNSYGSIMISAGPDTIWTYFKGKQLLHIIGRRTRERIFYITFDNEIMSWIVKGEYQEEQELSESNQEIINLLKTEGKALTIKEIAKRIGKSYDVTKATLSRLAKRGEIVNTGRGRYIYPPSLEGRK